MPTRATLATLMRAAIEITAFNRFLIESKLLSISQGAERPLPRLVRTAVDGCRFAHRMHRRFARSNYQLNANSFNRSPVHRRSSPFFSVLRFGVNDFYTQSFRQRPPRTRRLISVEARNGVLYAQTVDEPLSPR